MDAPDHFIKRDGLEFAGSHLIIDLWGAHNLCSREIMENALIEATKEAGATLLHIHLHSFGEECGVSGVAVLAESHISVHTWPERQYAAFDVFMCGDAIPSKAVAVFQKVFRPSRTIVAEHKRGLVTS